MSTPILIADDLWEGDAEAVITALSDREQAQLPRLHVRRPGIGIGDDVELPGQDGGPARHSAPAQAAPLQLG